jgi:Family of unknown function (DUF5670)
MSIFTILFVVLLVAWLLGLTGFHVAGWLIHVLLTFNRIVSVSPVQTSSRSEWWKSGNIAKQHPDWRSRVLQRPEVLSA